MGARDLLMAAAGAAGKLYVDDVFSAYPYTGNGEAQTINNGIDLATYGGLVRFKGRDSGGFDNCFFDTARGVTARLIANSTAASQTDSNSVVSFNSNGFSLGASTSAETNGAGYRYVSGTFRRAPKFFDVVLFTTSATANTNQRIAHALGVMPGMVVLKAVGAASSWPVWHRSLTDQTSYYLLLNGQNAQANYGNCFGTAAPSSSDFGINTNFLGTNQQMVAYVFAHDAAADGLIQCGSFTTDGSGNATVNLGWEPQYCEFKAVSTTGDWKVVDQARGWNLSGSSNTLLSNSNAAEDIYSNHGYPTATGFKVQNGGNAVTYVFLAVRRPNKPPTSGAQVYNAIARTGTGGAATVNGVGFAPDLINISRRELDGSGRVVYDRLRGADPILRTTGSAAESTGWAGTALASFGADGMALSADGSGATVNQSGATYINHFFRRAPGVLDIVCYTGTGAAHDEAHNLGVAPELMIVKSRSAATSWYVTGDAFAVTEDIVLDSTAAKLTNAAARWNSTRPTATVFSLGTGTQTNNAGSTYVAHLFASKAGISKVGSYTGNGASQAINCGFSAGARFVLIKRTDNTGDWFVWDTARGIVAGNDPHLSLNSTAAEVTTDDSIDPDASGFVVNQVAATNINVNGATYLFLAIA